MFFSKVSQNGLFLTFTCNQHDHFGLSNVRRWINNYEFGLFKKIYGHLAEHELTELKKSLEQASSEIFLRKWMEVRLLFLDYLLKSRTSPLVNVSELFARDEYQGEAGNLPHIHAIVSLNWEEINDDKKSALKDLVRASYVNIV